MLDNELIKIIIATIIAGEEIAGIANTPIKQAFQPTQQGVNKVATAYLHKVSDRRYGFPRIIDVWDSGAGKMVEQTTQQYETTFQISALSIQNPANTTQYTASDILNLIAFILQSRPTVELFQSQGIGIERITDIRNPYFKDDKDRFEASPSMDFVITHKQIILATAPVSDTTEIRVKSV